MKNTQWIFIAALYGALLFGSASFAERPARRHIQINEDPNTALCRQTARAAAELREGWGTLTSRFYRPEDLEQLSAHNVTFPAWLTKSFVFTNAAGEQRTLPISYHSIDIDNAAPAEMIQFIAGGHMATGEGTTLMIMSKDFSEAQEPLPDTVLSDVTMCGTSARRAVGTGAVIKE